MVQGRNVKAEIDIPQTLEVPGKAGKFKVDARISLHNDGEEDFIAHANSAHDRHFWHVLDEHQQEVLREKGKGKGGATGVKVRKGVHSYETATVAAGHRLHHGHTLTLDARKLQHGHTYTVRGEFFGHKAETTFVALKQAPKKAKKKAKKKVARKAAAPKAAAKSKKRPARKAKKKVMRGPKKK